MRTLIVCALFAVVAAQLFPFWNGTNSDRHNGYTFEYHSRHNLMVVRDSGNCYLFKASSDVLTQYKDKSQRDALEDKIIAQIKDSSNLTKETPFEALRHYHDPLEAAECRRKTIYELSFTI